MSRVPGGGNKPMFGSALMDASPDAFLSMGLTAENVASRFNVTREEQDAFAVQSHARALAAIASGRFDDEIVPGAGHALPAGPDGSSVAETTVVTVDEGPRPGSTMETPGQAQAGLQEERHGHRRQLLANERRRRHAHPHERREGRPARPQAPRPLRQLRRGGVDPGVMGIGPIVAIPKALRLAGLTVDDLDLVELNEAFASQAVYVMRHLGLDPEKTNVNGGAIALGHPLGATGAKLTATLLHEMEKRQSRYGIVSMCVAGGIGAAAIFERL